MFMNIGVLNCVLKHSIASKTLVREHRTISELIAQKAITSKLGACAYSIDNTTNSGARLSVPFSPLNEPAEKHTEKATALDFSWDFLRARTPARVTRARTTK